VTKESQGGDDAKRKVLAAGFNGIRFSGRGDHTARALEEHGHKESQRGMMQKKVVAVGFAMNGGVGSDVRHTALLARRGRRFRSIAARC